MSISSEISRISGNVSDALTAIANKGVTVPSGSNSDDLADLIGQISGGGGGTTWETIYQNNVSIQDWGEDVNYVYIQNYSSSYETFLIGDTYRITWQGVQYECVAYNQSGTACVGDLVNEPFLGNVDYSGNLLFETHDSPGTFSLKIEKQVSGGGGSTLITKTITANGTYDAEDDDADGYSEVTVNVQGGGSSFTLLYSTEVSVATTSTTNTELTTISTGATFTTNKTYFVSVRDKAGKRNGYFYGNDGYFVMDTVTNTTRITGRCFGVNSSGNYIYSTSLRGVFPYRYYGGNNNGQIQINQRYDSSVGTVNGTYIIKVYEVAIPDELP